MSAATVPSFKFLPMDIQGVHAQRLDSPYIRLFTVVNFLSERDCKTIVQAIDQQVVPSPVVGQQLSPTRTSETSYLTFSDPTLSATLDQRISGLLGVDATLSEPIQGQRYQQGQFYGAHYDWFDPNDLKGQAEIQTGGQRTWTFMIYLNDVAKGGETRFDKLGLQFQPSAGLALCWRNLLATGEPNQNALHSALPVLQGTKYIITKWFREKPGRNSA